jgi:hypothetical protein
VEFRIFPEIDNARISILDKQHASGDVATSNVATLMDKPTRNPQIPHKNLFRHVVRNDNCPLLGDLTAAHKIRDPASSRKPGLSPHVPASFFTRHLPLAHPVIEISSALLGCRFR